MFCNQFKGVQLQSLVKDYVQVELTFAGRMPQDLEELLIESLQYGLDNDGEDVLEDTVSKINDYRKLFGAG